MEEGWLYRSTWHLQSDLSIQYVVRCHPPEPPSTADIFVSLDEAVKLLTEVTGKTVRPPMIETIWTINTEDSDLDLCPLSEFVYQAAVKASGKKFRKVYDGILNEILRSLYSPREISELSPYTEGSSGSNSKITEDVIGWNDVVEMLHSQDEELEGEEESGDIRMEADLKLEAEKKLKSDSNHHPARRKSKKRIRELDKNTPEKYNNNTVKLDQLETLHERQTVREDSQSSEMFVCGLSLCRLKFDRYLSLVGHERTHVDSYICILCGLCCQSAENLIAHSDSEHPRKSQFICRVCGFFNRKPDQLATHVQQEHMVGSVMFQCEEEDCHYVTEKKQSLHAHKRTAHSDQEHFCHICGKNYASAASLYVHKKSHEPDFKKFQCQLCPRTFAYSSGLSYHMAVHTGEKPFSCPQCANAFGSHTALSRHVKVVHAEEKDMVYQCDHCGKKFPRRMGREFKDHVKIHTGERDHICSICGSGYFSRKMLRKHELKKHQNLLPKKPQPVRINPDSVPQLQVQPNYNTLSLQVLMKLLGTSCQH